MNKKLIVLAGVLMLGACGDYSHGNRTTESNNNQLRGYANDRSHKFGYNETKNADSNATPNWGPGVRHSHDYNERYYTYDGYYNSPTWQGW